MRASLLFVTLGIYLLHSQITKTESKTLHISSFEYTRKFPPWSDSNVRLGQCANEIVRERKGAVAIRCLKSWSTGETQRLARTQSDTQNVYVGDVDTVFKQVGLCNCDAVTTFGLLHNGGDCLAVEVAGNLTFNKKTYTRMYVEYYQHGVDVQRGGRTNIPAPLRQQFRRNYYNQYIAYGTLEVVVVELKFRKKTQVEMLRKSNMKAGSLSDWFEYAVTEVGSPRKAKIVRVSSAQNMFKIHKFRSNADKEILTELKKYESIIKHTKEGIKRGHIKHHLKYGFTPYIAPTKDVKKGKCNVHWEKAAKLQIAVSRIVSIQRRIKRMCKSIKIPECTMTKEMMKKARKLQRELHSYRAKWNSLSDSKKHIIIQDTRTKLRSVKQPQYELLRRLKSSAKRKKKKT